MSSPVIKVENLSKLYHIGAMQAGPRTLVGTTGNILRTTWKRLIDPRIARSGSANVEELWALKDVNFELKQGEVLGVIGSNGSGKSTLLKILSRITAPTSGRVRLYGRVGSLLEVGVGFHPQLTGRENIYLNGAILGMKRAQIDRIFDEIVDFSEIERFIDTPVKHYSSGMYVRLAFAVASHFDPEVLILDEVLAVGDAGFQRKSLGKMESAAKGGKTVIYVSHALASVARLCDTGLYLEKGMVKFLGSAIDAVENYLHEIHKIDPQDPTREGAFVNLWDSDKRWDGYTQKILKSVSTHRIDGTPTTTFVTGEPMRIRIGYHLEDELQAYCNINFLNYTGLAVMTVGLHHSKPRTKLVGDGVLECIIPELRLVSGKYILMLSIGSHSQFDERNALDSVSDTIHISVEIDEYLGGYEVSQSESPFAQRSEWHIESEA
jgi:lipopolysaccharide transport system ATP-binding protein